MGKEPETTLKEDLLVGAKAAAEYIGVSSRIVYDMVEKGHLPVVKIGEARNARLFFRKSAIDATFSPAGAGQ